MPDFLPRKDGDLVAWMGNFTRRLQATPGKYPVPIESIDQCAALQATFAAAYQKAASLGTRSRADVQAREMAKRAAVRSVRMLSGILRTRWEISESDLVLLGLKRRKATHSRRTCPQAAPILTVTKVQGSRVTLQLRDPEIPFRKAKPTHVVMATVLYCLGEDASDGSPWALFCSMSRTTRTLRPVPGVQAGDKVWFRAYWTSARGEQSATSAPVYARVQFGETQWRSSDRQWHLSAAA